MHISIIDDERILSEKIAKKIRNNGFSASSFLWYGDFMKNGDAESQLYIIDLSLRDGNGVDIVRWLRKDQRSTAPIIIISGHDDVQSKIFWLDSGADDYLVKPFPPDELIARIKALLRRSNKMDDRTILYYKSIRFDRENREVFLWNNQVHLTRTEQIILETFLKNTETVISRGKIISNVWWNHRYVHISDNTITVHISNIKRKLGDDFSVSTEYGNGYMLRY